MTVVTLVHRAFILQIGDVSDQQTASHTRALGDFREATKSLQLLVAQKVPNASNPQMINRSRPHGVRIPDPSIVYGINQGSVNTNPSEPPKAKMPIRARTPSGHRLRLINDTGTAIAKSKAATKYANPKAGVMAFECFAKNQLPSRVRGRTRKCKPAPAGARILSNTTSQFSGSFIFRSCLPISSVPI